MSDIVDIQTSVDSLEKEESKVEEKKSRLKVFSNIKDQVSKTANLVKNINEKKA